MSDIVAIARSWIGTPYVHQASTRGAGADCLGLIRGIWREMRGIEPEPVPSYSSDWAEPQSSEVLQEAAARHMTVVAAGESWILGEILLFRITDASIAKHLGVLASLGSQSTFIHAYSGHGVVESSFSLPWKRRIAGRYLFPTSTRLEIR